MKTNKLIAEYMGEATQVWNDPDPIEGNDYRIRKRWGGPEIIHIQYGDGEYLSEAEVLPSEIVDIEFDYHKSWDSLFPVVMEIEKTNLATMIIHTKNFVEISYNGSTKKYYSSNLIGNVYEAVINFIKWTNRFNGTYSVWVGGGEVNDHYLTKKEANELSEYYKELGYDDVAIREEK